MRHRIATIVAIAICSLPFDARAFCRAMTCNPAKETCEVDDRGCVTSGTALRWPAERLPLVFRFQQQHSARLVPEETTAAVRAAFHRWSDVVCPDGRRTSLRFTEGEDLVADKPLEAGAPRPEPFGIYFRDRGWPHPSGDDQTALTTIDFAPSSGTILYADIEVNTTAWTYATRDVGEGIDLQTVVTHEVGHFIGLAHAREPNTIMAGHLCDSGDRCARDRVSSRRLATDDISAVCALYPPDAERSAPAPPSAAAPSCTVHALGASPRGLPLLVVVLAGLAAIRRKTRNRGCRAAEFTVTVAANDGLRRTPIGQLRGARPRTSGSRPHFGRPEADHFGRPHSDLIGRFVTIERTIPIPCMVRWPGTPLALSGT